MNLIYSPYHYISSQNHSILHPLPTSQAQIHHYIVLSMSYASLSNLYLKIRFYTWLLFISLSLAWGISFISRAVRNWQVVGCSFLLIFHSSWVFSWGLSWCVCGLLSTHSNNLLSLEFHIEDLIPNCQLICSLCWCSWC